MNVAACKTDWSNAQNCVEIDFSVRLKMRSKNDSKQTNSSIGQITDSTKYYDLSREEMFTMWIEFGRSEFNDNGFKVEELHSFKNILKKKFLLSNRNSLFLMLQSCFCFGVQSV